MQNNKPTSGEKQKKYSIITYLVILFAVVIALVLLSYFVQLRRDNSDMASFRNEHLTRLGRLEEQAAAQEERLGVLEEKLNTLEATQSELYKNLAERNKKADSYLDELNGRLDETKEEIEALRSELDALLEENGNKE